MSSRKFRALLAAMGASLVLGAMLPAASATPPVVAPTPPLGWNSWNTFRCQINEKLIEQSADAMVSSGMKAAGYRYVVIDDCWFDPTRAADGSLRANPTTFPHGIKALADYVHQRGLRLGIYETPGPKTCAQADGTYPGVTGSQGHEAQDAKTFASWGIDYLKYDLCTVLTLQDQIKVFTKMRDALRATGRPIVYSINSNSYSPTRTGDAHDWSSIANMWRVSDDIQPFWDTSGNRPVLGWGVTDIIDLDAPLAARAGPGHWNDDDMLVADVAILGGKIRLTPVQARSHVSMWAMLAAPLLAGNDIRSMTPETRTLLTEPQLLAIDQDPLGKQATRRSGDAHQSIWTRPLANGDTAVALLNRQGTPITVKTTLAELGIANGGQPLDVHDVWGGRTFKSAGPISATLPPYGVFLLRVGHRVPPSAPHPLKVASSDGMSPLAIGGAVLAVVVIAGGVVVTRRRRPSP